MADDKQGSSTTRARDRKTEERQHDESEISHLDTVVQTVEELDHRTQRFASSVTNTNNNSSQAEVVKSKTLEEMTGFLGEHPQTMRKKKHGTVSLMI